jgi:hypothetical protein
MMIVVVVKCMQMMSRENERVRDVCQIGYTLRLYRVKSRIKGRESRATAATISPFYRTKIPRFTSYRDVRTKREISELYIFVEICKCIIVPSDSSLTSPV